MTVPKRKGTQGQANELWATRGKSLDHLRKKHPSYLLVLNQELELIDRCIDVFESHANESDYARYCGLTLLKAKNLAVASYSLILDGLGQESGAVIRPFIEYAELLVYFRLYPKSIEEVTNGSLPKAGKIGKQIDGIYQEFRKYLNDHASHSSFSRYSLDHLIDPRTMQFKKLQQIATNVLETNLINLTVQLHLLVREAAFALSPLDQEKFQTIAGRVDDQKERMVRVFGLNKTETNTDLRSAG